MDDARVAVQFSASARQVFTACRGWTAKVCRFWKLPASLLVSPLGGRLGSRLGSRLWQRIFIYTLLLVLLSQAITFGLVYLEMDSRETRRDNMAAFIHDIILENLNGRAADDAKLYLDYCNGNGPQLWFERPDGTVLSGVPVAGLTRKDRENLRSVPSRWPNIRVWEAEGLAWETGPSEPLGLLVAEFNFREGPVVLCYTYWNGRFPHVEDFFYQGLTALLLLGGVLSFWMARHVSTPLRRLQQEVSGIGGSTLDRQVTVQGTGEVADVASAVNHLTGTLSRHIRGMHELVANISHELRSPLTRMDFATTFVEQGLEEAHLLLASAEAGQGGALLPQPDPQRKSAARLALAGKHMRYLREELEHMEKLIGTTLFSCKLDLQQPQDHAPLDLSRLVRDTAASHAPLLEGSGFVFICEITDELHISGDASLIRQMVSNLVDNAFKYTEPSGTIRLSVSWAVPQAAARAEALPVPASVKEIAVAHKQACLRVDNIHPPLAGAVLDRLFDPFYRGGVATGNGVGLGLSLVQKIVALHSGTAKAENTLLENKSAVRIEILLPLVEEQQD